VAAAPALTPARLSDVFARSDRIVARRIGGEYVLVPLLGRGSDADFIYTLSAVAAAMWEALDGRRSGEEVVRTVVEQFEVDEPRAGRDYLGLMETLESIEAVRRL
jgi:coenzyme PQQ synthesis protein D (PqqD)